MSVFALTICLALAPQSPGAGPRDANLDRPAVAREIRHVPIREWMGTSPTPLLPRLGSFLGNTEGRGPSSAMFLLGRGEFSQQMIDRDAIADLVRQFAPDEMETEDGVSMHVEGATLRLSGAPDKVQRLETTIRDLTRAMVHNIRLQAELFRLPQPGEFAATITSDQLAGLRRDHQRIWTSTTNCISGNIASLNKDRTTNYVFDVDVEVAQGSKIGDPNTASLFEGVRVAVEPHVLTSSTDLVLYAQFAFGELRAPTVSRDTGINDMPSLDVPTIDCNSGTMSGRISDGGALVLSVQGDPAGGGNMLLAISGQQEGTGRGTGEQLGIFPVSALLSPSLRATVQNVTIEDDRAFPLHLQRTAQDNRNLGPVDQAQLQDLIFGALDVEESGDYVTIAGNHLIVKGSGTTRQGAERMLQTLQEEWLSTARVDLRTTLHEVHFGSGVFSREASTATAGAGRTLHQITFPALLGRSHTLMRGHESTVIRDNDVEIAQKSSISNPVVDQIFSGIVLSLYVYPQTQGVGVEFDLDLFDTATPQRRVAETKDGGDLYLPVTGRSRFNHRGPVTSARDLLLGDGPTVRLGEQSFRTQQVLRITVP